VRRDPDPQDRRAKRISVTPAGTAAVEASEPVREQFMKDVFKALDQSEQDALTVLLDKLNARLQLLEQADMPASSD